MLMMPADDPPFSIIDFIRFSRHFAIIFAAATLILPPDDYFRQPFAIFDFFIRRYLRAPFHAFFFSPRRRAAAADDIFAAI